MLPMICLRVERSKVGEQAVHEALALLEDQPGAYLGVEAGVPGLHPLQATLTTQTALALEVFADRVQVQAHTPMGQAVLQTPPLVAWQTRWLEKTGLAPLQSLREFLRCFAPSPEVMLMGALNFEAHRLAQPDGDARYIGTLYFVEHSLRRDASGAWWLVQCFLPPGPASAPVVAAGAAQKPPQMSPQTAVAEPRDDHPPGGYADMVRAALQALRDEGLVSLTLSQSYRRRVQMRAVDAFARLRSVNPAPACFFFNAGQGERLFGASPDLQLVVQQRRVQSFPVCGTVARGSGPLDEAEALQDLLNESVDAASLAVCTDALRNDLAPWCEPTSMKLVDRRKPMTLATVIHAVDHLQAQLLPDSDAWDLVAATAAPVMVTGTPRAKALQAIQALEASPRRWYGGLMLQVSSDGDALVATILRAAAVRDGVAEVRTGGDLMADSSPQREEQESRLKSLSLWRALGQATALDKVTTRASNRVEPLAVRLVDAQDPFGASMKACLQGLGVHLDAAARCALWVGALDAQALPERQAVMVGNAAYRLLHQAGFAVRETLPENGRQIRCRSLPSAPVSWPATFHSARYARFELADQALPAGWQVWAEDADSHAVVWGHAERRLVCIACRPDSLMSDDAARQFLLSALAHAAAEEEKT